MLATFETRGDSARADRAEDRLEVLGRSLFQPTGSNGVHARLDALASSAMACFRQWRRQNL